MSSQARGHWGGVSTIYKSLLTKLTTASICKSVIDERSVRQGSNSLTRSPGSLNITPLKCRSLTHRQVQMPSLNNARFSFGPLSPSALVRTVMIPPYSTSCLSVFSASRSRASENAKHRYKSFKPFCSSAPGHYRFNIFSKTRLTHWQVLQCN